MSLPSGLQIVSFFIRRVCTFSSVGLGLHVFTLPMNRCIFTVCHICFIYEIKAGGPNNCVHHNASGAELCIENYTAVCQQCLSSARSSKPGNESLGCVHWRSVKSTYRTFRRDRQRSGGTSILITSVMKRVTAHALCNTGHLHLNFLQSWSIVGAEEEAPWNAQVKSFMWVICVSANANNWRGAEPEPRLHAPATLIQLFSVCSKLLMMWELKQLRGLQHTDRPRVNVWPQVSLLVVFVVCCCCSRGLPSF